LKKILTAILSATLLLGMTACGGKATPETSAPQESGEEETGTAGAAKEGITLGFAQVGSESEFRTANTTDIKESAEAFGIDLQYSDAQQKQENQIKAIRTFIASEVDVISFCPIVQTGWDTVLQEAKDAGIPVILVDRGVDADESLYVSRVGVDAVAEGADAFGWIDNYIEEIGKTPRDGGDTFNIAILEGTVGSSIAADRLNGFKDAIGESPNADKFEVILSQTGEYTRAKGNEVMESFLKSDGDRIDILFAANDDMALGAIQAIKAAGLTPAEDIIIVSIDAAKGAFNAMINGEMNAAVEHNPLMGDKLMEIVEDVVAGKEVERMYYVKTAIYDQANAEAELPNRKY
jgi:ABC-type sugar transport system substrate-binding protein